MKIKPPYCRGHQRRQHRQIFFVFTRNNCDYTRVHLFGSIYYYYLWEDVFRNFLGRWRGKLCGTWCPGRPSGRTVVSFVVDKAIRLGFVERWAMWKRKRAGGLEGGFCWLFHTIFRVSYRLCLGCRDSHRPHAIGWRCAQASLLPPWQINLSPAFPTSRNYF